MHQRGSRSERRHREEYADVTDSADEFCAAQAAQRKAEEIGRAHDTDRHRGELLQRGPNGQQRALQTLAGKQYGDADQQGGNGCECVFHGAAFWSFAPFFGSKRGWAIDRK